MLCVALSMRCAASSKLAVCRSLQCDVHTLSRAARTMLQAFAARHQHVAVSSVQTARRSAHVFWMPSSLPHVVRALPRAALPRPADSNAPRNREGQADRPLESLKGATGPAQ